MKIKYSKKRLISYLRMGLFFIVMGIILLLFSFVTGEFKGISLTSIGIGQLAAGLFIIAIYYFENQKHYLTIKDGVLIKHALIPKKIKLSEIKSFREFAGDYTLETDKEQFVINTQLIEVDSLAELKRELGKFNVVWS